MNDAINFLDFTNNIGVFLSNGSKSFGGQTMFFVGEGSRPSSVAIGHFNNDNQVDIAVANCGTSNIGILLGYENRTFTNVTTYSTGISAREILCFQFYDDYINHKS
jgi:hypothetical protein